MTRYINSNGVYYNGQSLLIDGNRYFDPSEEIILRAGYTKIENEEDKSKELLNAKANKIDEIIRYDTSSNINCFTFNGQKLWFDKATRVGLMNSTNIQISNGEETTTIWYNGNSYTLPCETLKAILKSVELYALKCYNVTEMHKAHVWSLTTIEEVEAFDITSDYPAKPIYSYK